MRYTRLIIPFILLVLLATTAHAQMPLRNPAWAQINPWFEGAEAIYSSPTVQAFNYYGNYWLDVVGLPPGVGIWQPAVNPRTGNPIAELIPVHQGREVLVYDWASADYLSLMYDNTVEAAYYDAYDAGVGVADHRFYGEAGYQLWVVDGGFAMSVAAPEALFLEHDGTEGTVGTLIDGDLQLDAFADVYTNDDVGIGTNAPGDELHVVGSIRMVDGTQGVGQVMIDDGAGVGTATWGLPDGLVQYTVGATVAVEGCETTDFDTGIVMGTASIAWVVGNDFNSGVYFNVLSSPIPVADQISYYWFEGSDGDLHIEIMNDSQRAVECICWFCTY